MSDAIDSDLTALLHSQMPLTRHLGLRAVAGDQESVVTEASWSEDFCTAGGVIHGGFLMAMADTTGAMLAVFNLPAGAITSTIESKTNFLRPVGSGDVTATSTLVHKGRTTIVVETDIVDEAGKLVTRTTQTQAVISRSPDPQPNERAGEQR